ncbi:uncharacterized protein MYCGRDRAFT_38718 [Zymoseptoria tritici IPO323]|uniref:Major facilitator superfamily (MFS) profile domain-containing protein n=1 Tax=Zymoseptoria tritici (strain CBS 115943 / IPO323) TaxID=336722 RepID=F9X5G7_ZYMTI|nr:uncharacterized protein MYCGRDRAFT_38718 [Zymoseptoria tritici IPO323]EGP88612.1 hypothetical protein MYCGRDRAFT_38718 [Zymoseptoria tritici IPO323]
MTVYANDTPSNKSNPEKNAASVDHLNETSVPYIVPDKPITPELLAAVPGGVKASELFEDAAPILALNLPDWRATEKKLAQAQLAEPSMGESLNFESGGEDYNTAVSLLTVGYMIMQLPSNMLLTRVRPGIYLPATAIIWSAVSACTAAVPDVRTLWGVRFILGMTEAPLFPGAVYLLSCWYTRKEIALRIAILYSGLVLAQAMSGILAAGIFNGMEGVAGIMGWQWLFIIEALMSTVCGIAALFLLPDYPESKTGSQKWTMDEDCRRLAVARVEADRVTGSTGSGKVWDGIKLVMTDPKMYLFMFLNLTMTASYGFNFFFPILVQGLGIGNRIVSLLLTSPPYFLGAAVSFAIARDSDRIRERGYHIVGSLTASMIGFVITVATPNTAARYAASFLYAPGSFSANALVYSWAVSSAGQTPEKRAAAGAIVNIVGHVGNIISPYFFRDDTRPEYPLAWILMLVFGALAMGLALSTKFFLKFENRRIKRRTDDSGAVYNPYTT